MPRNHTDASIPKFAALGQSLLRTAVANQAALPTNNSSMPRIGSRLKLTTTAPASMMPKQNHLITAIIYLFYQKKPPQPQAQLQQLKLSYPNLALYFPGQFSALFFCEFITTTAVVWLPQIVWANPRTVKVFTGLERTPGNKHHADDGNVSQHIIAYE